jgi:hypothetical protein
MYLKQTISRVYNVVAVPRLHFMIHVMLFPMLSILYFYIGTFLSMCAVPSTALFWGYVIHCFPGVLLRYFLNDLGMAQSSLLFLVSLLFAHALHLLLRTLYFRIFSVSLLNTILSADCATFTNIRVPLSLLRITMSGFLFRMVFNLHLLMP